MIGETAAMTDQIPPCKFCGQSRVVLAVGVLIFVLVSIQPESTFLVGVDVTNVFAWLVAGMSAMVVVWKVYKEYWK
jgi:hypothetical protein|tara:strand:- start:354 stop:581 length:228 start_codon:yes stop_codon:yes gene_type:complete